MWPQRASAEWPTRRQVIKCGMLTQKMEGMERKSGLGGPIRFDT